jgi:hypothetical protein
MSAPRFSQEQVDQAIDFVINDSAIDRARTVRYTAVFENAGMEPPQELHAGGESDLVGQFMKAFHDRCNEHRLPPLDSLVVHVAGQREGRHGAGYFRVNGHVDPFADPPVGSPEAAVLAISFWETEKATVAEWGTKRRRGRS